MHIDPIPVNLKNVLVAYSDQRSHWFAFSAARIRERVLVWLQDEGITASLKEER